jgi:hypothetical protein
MSLRSTIAEVQQCIILRGSQNDGDSWDQTLAADFDERGIARIDFPAAQAITAHTTL